MRPIWKGPITFGLVHIPIELYPAIARNDVTFHLIDSRNHERIRYIRVNEETGEEVPWSHIVKGYEYNKGDYVVIEEKELKRASSESSQTLNIENFVPLKELNCIYFETPYFIIPDKKAQKGYVLLRETLKKTQTAGIAKIVIRTREYLAALLPYGDGLLLNLLRYDQEFRDIKNLNFPKGKLKEYRISPNEIAMGEKLVSAMTVPWEPKKYHDEYREELMSYINEKIKRKGKAVTSKPKKARKTKPSDEIDLMSLLKKSVQEKKIGWQSNKRSYH